MISIDIVQTDGRVADEHHRSNRRAEIFLLPDHDMRRPRLVHTIHTNHDYLLSD